jgi:hypothetical protein
MHIHGTVALQRQQLTHHGQVTIIAGTPKSHTPFHMHINDAVP